MGNTKRSLRSASGTKNYNSVINLEVLSSMELNLENHPEVREGYSLWLLAPSQLIKVLFSCTFQTLLIHSVVSGLLVTPWTIACQAPLPMEFFRQAYWSEVPFYSPGDLPDPGIEPTSPVSPTLQADSLPLSHRGNHYIMLLLLLSRSVVSTSLWAHGCSTPGLPVLHQLPELAQTHVH